MKPVASGRKHVLMSPACKNIIAFAHFYPVRKTNINCINNIIHITSFINIICKTASHGNASDITDHSWVICGLRPRKPELWCFLCCQSEWYVEQTFDMPMFWDVMTPLQHEVSLYIPFHYTMNGHGVGKFPLTISTMNHQTRDFARFPQAILLLFGQQKLMRNQEFERNSDRNMFEVSSALCPLLSWYC